MKGLYLETSVIARAFMHLEADDYATLQRAIEDADSVFTSVLTIVELRRTADQLAHLESERATRLLDNALNVLANADVVPLTEEVLTRAGGPFPLRIRTLDALHVATALQVKLRPEITSMAMMSRDKRVRDVAAAVGLQLV